jgi:predicted LPLAT superfamily acyltransferase
MIGFRACVVIPTHNHVDALEPTLLRLEADGLDVIVVDDGSAVEIGTRILQVCSVHPNVEYRRQTANGGKGLAIMSGIARAGERGFTHAVQIDADGQHDLADLEPLLAEARLNPAAIVSGVPQYDRSMPLIRRIWRPFTNFWVHVSTLSSYIRDAMCGFRVYPIAMTQDLVRRSVRGRRMDFEIEILVKAYWAGIAMAFVPVRVTYPEGNFSNFDLFRDNVRLAWLQTKLFFGMLLRSPVLVFFRPLASQRGTDAPAPWSRIKERGAYWGLRSLAGVYRIFGREICLAAMTPVVFYFFATGRVQREASHDFLTRAWRLGYLPKSPTLWLSFRHFMSFAASGLDTLAAWTGRLHDIDVKGAGLDVLNAVEAGGHGAFVITAHIGNPEVIRAVAVLGGRVPVNVLMHTENAQLFNRLIREFSPDAPVRAIAVTSVGPDTAIMLSKAVAKGEWVVIVGDRIPVAAGGRTVEAPFLGDMAPFPQGPYILGALLKVPAYLLFCVRGKSGFDVHFSKFADPIELPRRDRVGAIARYAALYAQALEARVADTPLQWFNFYSFWSASRDASSGVSVAQKAAE